MKRFFELFKDCRQCWIELQHLGISQWDVD